MGTVQCTTWLHILSVFVDRKGHWTTAKQTELLNCGDLCQILIGSQLYLLLAFLTHHLEEGLKPQSPLLHLELKLPVGNVCCMILALSVGSLIVTLKYMINTFISLQLLSWSEQRPRSATRPQPIYGGHNRTTMHNISGQCCPARH